MKIDIVCTPPSAFGSLWPAVGGLLLRGMNKAELPVLETMDKLRSGELRLWLVKSEDPPTLHAVFMTGESEIEGQSSMIVMGLAGSNPKAWARQLSRVVADAAKASGYTRVEFAGSKAWARLCEAVEIKGEVSNGVARMVREARHVC